jgi:hypothetical protein
MARGGGDHSPRMAPDAVLPRMAPDAVLPRMAPDAVLPRMALDAVRLAPTRNASPLRSAESPHCVARAVTSV